MKWIHIALQKQRTSLRPDYFPALHSSRLNKPAPTPFPNASWQKSKEKGREKNSERLTRYPKETKFICKRLKWKKWQPLNGKFNPRVPPLLIENRVFQSKNRFILEFKELSFVLFVCWSGLALLHLFLFIAISQQPVKCQMFHRC